MCYDDSPAEVEKYKGYRIEIKRDEVHENPFDSWDCEPPIAVLSYDCSRSRITEHATQYGHVNEVPTLTREQIKANWAEIKPLLECPSVFAIRADVLNCGDVVEAVNESLRRYVDGLSDSDRLETLATLYGFAGIPAYVGVTRGYSQGDYAEVLVVLTPEFIEATGAPATQETMEQAVKLYGYWAWGDVYGWLVKDADGEAVDSCWGYYGDYPGYGVTVEAAKEQIDWLVEENKRRRFAQIKTWIRNRVPLHYREV